MRKLKWVYICDMCGKVALPHIGMPLCGMGDIVKGPPLGWTSLRNYHYCVTCTKVLRKED